MRWPALHHPPRLLCLGGLLLLAAAEGRFHAKPLTEPLPPRAGLDAPDASASAAPADATACNAAGRLDPARGEPVTGGPRDRQPGQDGPTRVPLALLSTLPDPAPVRRAATAAELVEADPRATLSWSADCGRPDGGVPGAELGSSAAPSAMPRVPAAIVPAHASGYVPHLALSGSICRTGPPHA